MKPFDLEAAKRGDPVVNREGRKVRLICFDMDDASPIIGLISYNTAGEAPFEYRVDGTHDSSMPQHDLFMATKLTKWVNVYEQHTYDSRKEAEICAENMPGTIYTMEVEWEE
jgi:hypothetical protein